MFPAMEVGVRQRPPAALDRTISRPPSSAARSASSADRRRSAAAPMPSPSSSTRRTTCPGSRSRARRRSELGRAGRHSSVPRTPRGRAWSLQQPIVAVDQVELELDSSGELLLACRASTSPRSSRAAGRRSRRLGARPRPQPGSGRGPHRAARRRRCRHCCGQPRS